MRIAVISDIHGNLGALVAVLEDIGRQPPDAILNLGDSLSGPFDPVGVATLLMQLDLPTVSGNHDRWVRDVRPDDWPIDGYVRDRLGPAQMRWLASLPDTRVHEGTVFMCHGTPQSDSAAWMDSVQPDGSIDHKSAQSIEAAGQGVDFPVLLCGHSHIPRSLRMADGRLLVNPGSVGWQFGFGSPDAHYAIIERRAGTWRVEHRAVPYDAGPMAAAARAAGYPSFVEMLRTGWPSPYEL